MDNAITFDPAKNRSNIEKHSVPLSLAGEILKRRVFTLHDERFDYGEVRNITFGYVRDRLHVAVWVDRGGSIRAISVRKANKREVQRYGRDN